MIALITGITGQDGSYLAELLLDKGYEVHGIVRRSSQIGRDRLNSLYRDPSIFGRRLFLHYADLEDTTTLRRIIGRVKPAEFYHLAGQSHVGLSFEIPESTCDLTANGTLRILEILRDVPAGTRFLHASSREIFGTPLSSPQNEQTPMVPNSPYGCAKVFATNVVRVYREAHGMFCCNAICFNHESPRRGENFITRKVSLAAAEISLGLRSELVLGDLDACRDWGYAPDFVHAMWLMLQNDTASDFVLATGVSKSIRELLSVAFGHLGLRWEDYVRFDSRFVRPADASSVLGDPSKAERELGWKRRVDFDEMISLMVDEDVKRLSAKL
ncbi:MAG: GDP-mannose 4,6-dehydratase [Planctomycetaceae bacterium]